jgi:hypothetical protein
LIRLGGEAAEERVVVRDEGGQVPLGELAAQIVGQGAVGEDEHVVELILDAAGGAVPAVRRTWRVCRVCRPFTMAV